MSQTVSNSLLLVAAAVAQKLIVFVVNQLSLQYTTPEIVGKASIQLELWLSTSLFVSREAIRVACLRYKIEDSPRSKHQFFNMAWTSLPLLALITFALFYTKLHWNHDESAADLSVYLLYSGAALVETLGEPLYNIYNNQCYIEPRIRAETIGFLVKSVVTFTTVAMLQWGVLGFGVAQLSFAVVYLVILSSYFKKFQLHLKRKADSEGPKLLLALSDLAPTWKAGPVYDQTMFMTAVYLSGSSVVKHVLTEADKISLTLSCSDYDQGIYAITNNYGSLVARLFYLPMEDSARLSLSYLQKQTPMDADAAASTAVVEKEAKKPQMYVLLLRLLKVVLVVGVGIAVFGPSYVSVFTAVVLRKQEGVATMNACLTYFCYYLLFMGANGIAEACLQVAAESFATTNVGLAVSSAGFALAAYHAVPRYGGAGIILANICSVVVRLLWNGCLLDGIFFARATGGATRVLRGLLFFTQVIPAAWWWGLMVLIKVLLQHSEARLLSVAGEWSLRRPKPLLLHVAIGGGFAAAFLIATFFTCSAEERKMVVDAVMRRIGRKRAD
eukprot:gene2565-1862_t